MVNEVGRVNSSPIHRRSELAADRTHSAENKTDSNLKAHENASSVVKTVASEAPVDFDKVNAIKEQISAGTYKIDAQKIAADMIGFVKKD